MECFRDRVSWKVAAETVGTALSANVECFRDRVSWKVAAQTVGTTLSANVECFRDKVSWKVAEEMVGSLSVLWLRKGWMLVPVTNGVHATAGTVKKDGK